MLRKFIYFSIKNLDTSSIENLNTNYHEKPDMLKCAMILYFLLATTLFIPESIYEYFDIYILEIFNNPPSIIKFYIENSSFPNATFIFFIIAPIILVVNSIFFIKRYNNIYSRFEKNKYTYSKPKDKKQDYFILMKSLFLIIIFIGIILNPVAPKAWGDFMLLKSRFAMAFLFAGGFGLLMPLALSLLIMKTREIFK